MKKTAHPLTMAMAILTALLVGGGPARAEEKPLPGSGALDAIGPGGKPLGACPLQHTDVAVEISGFVARVTVTQLFASRFTEPVEAVYTFPLSDRAAVDAMSMRTGERTIRGEIKRREEARRIYEAARAAGQVAALLDQERPNIFTQTLANLMPGATVEILHRVRRAARLPRRDVRVLVPDRGRAAFHPGRTDRSRRHRLGARHDTRARRLAHHPARHPRGHARRP